MRLLFVHDHPFYKDEEKVFSGGGLPQRAWVNYLPYFHSIRVFGRQSSNLKDKKVSSSGFDQVRFCLTKKYSSLSTLLKNFHSIRQEIKSEINHVDVVLVRLPSVLGFIAGFIAIRAKKKLWVEQVGHAHEALTNHGSFLGKIAASTFNKINLKLVRRADFVSYVTEKKLQLDYPTNGITVGISNVNIESIVSEAEIKNERFYNEKLRVCVIGGFDVKYKGQDILLKAISLLEDEIRANISLSFIGKGDSSWVMKIANQYGLSDNIEFIGGKEAGVEIFEYLKDISLYIQPSLTEGMPRALLEAMSVGCPVLGSNAGGIPDIIQENYIHETGNFSMLSKQIRDFYNDRNLLVISSKQSLKIAAPYLKSNLDIKRKKFYETIVNSCVLQKRKLVRVTTIPLSLEKLLGNQLSYMSNHFEVVAVSSDGPELRRVCSLFGIRAYEVNMTRKITLLKDLKALLKMYFFLRREKPFLVHTHTPKAGVIGMLAAKMAGVPNRLHTVAGLPLLEVTGFKRKVLNFVEKVTYASSTKVYPNSIGLRNIIINENFCGETKLKVIANGSSNGINTNYFNGINFPEESRLALRKTLGIMPFDFVFIFVGRLVGDKGINELVSVFKDIDTQNIKLLLVGPREEELDPLERETILEIEHNTNIIEVGYSSDIRPFLAISDSLVFPSYREGFPNVVMQAASMDLPCIVTNINGCNEIIINGKNGLIVQPKSKGELLVAMKTMMNDTDLRSHMSINARKSIVERYEQQLVWDAILSEYQNLKK